MGKSSDDLLTTIGVEVSPHEVNLYDGFKPKFTEEDITKQVGPDISNDPRRRRDENRRKNLDMYDNINMRRKHLVLEDESQRNTRRRSRTKR